MRRLTSLTLALVAAGTLTVLAQNGNANGQPKVTICHVPPGNPANAHSITIGEAGVPAHLANHAGDSLGACATNPSGSR